LFEIKKWQAYWNILVERHPVIPPHSRISKGSVFFLLCTEESITLLIQSQF